MCYIRGREKEEGGKGEGRCRDHGREVGGECVHERRKGEKGGDYDTVRGIGRGKKEVGRGGDRGRKGW